MVRRRVVVSGRVQGVFFRDSCRQEAERHGVAGWVANLPDGTAEIELEGAPEAVQAVVDWAHGGPASATVRSVAVYELPETGDGDFTVR